MGGIGYITSSLSAIARNNILSTQHARIQPAERSAALFFFFGVRLRRNSRAKLSGPLERRGCLSGRPGTWLRLGEALGRGALPVFPAGLLVETRIVRFHNVYGPLGTYEGGKEKAPAAISRKVALVRTEARSKSGVTGEQTRSFMYIDDCVEGLQRLMASDYREPLNLGNDQLVTINQLVDLVAAAAAGKRIRKRHDLTKPQGVRGRNSDNSRLLQVSRLGAAHLIARGPPDHLSVD